MAIEFLLFKSVGLVQNDFSTENDKLRAPNADGPNDEHQGDWGGGRKHKTPATRIWFIFVTFFRNLKLDVNDVILV